MGYNKNRITIQKHGISFETAALVFADEERIEYYDKLHSQTVIHPGQQPTEAQIREIEPAACKPVVPDQDTPELILEQYAEMAAIAKKRRSQQVKPVIALRISPETLDKAKATGKGYTGFLSRLLDNAINDPQLVSKSL